MIERTDFGDVTRLRMWTLRSVLVGYDVSAWIVRGVLLDTGPWHTRNDLLTVLRTLPVRGAIVTHWHEDHAGNVPVLAADRVPMWMAPYTEERLRAPFTPKFYRRFTWGASARLSGVVPPFDHAPLQVVHTPGHSADHHIVFDPETRTLFSSDLWLGVKVRVVGEEENPYEIVRSLDRAIALAPVRMFDAHRGLIERPTDALRAKRDWLAGTIDAIERRLDAGASEDAILREVLGGEESLALVTQGEYCRRNLVRTVRANRSSERASHGPENRGGAP